MIKDYDVITQDIQWTIMSDSNIEFQKVRQKLYLWFHSMVSGLPLFTWQKRRMTQTLYMVEICNDVTSSRFLTQSLEEKDQCNGTFKPYCCADQISEGATKKTPDEDPKVEMEDSPLIYKISDATPIHLTLFFAMQVS